MMNITATNTIYPVNDLEVQTRRQYQTAAIITCEQFLQEILYCEDVLPIKVSKFVPYIEAKVTRKNGWHSVEVRLSSSMTHGRGRAPRDKVEVLTANYPVKAVGAKGKVRRFQYE
jgi:hypothetical protein